MNWLGSRDLTVALLVILVAGMLWATGRLQRILVAVFA